ncbi:MAG: redoxin domain-containing protein [Acidobacteria bacterium]|nr:redoxin domain-containing protein [Acidobacteriota bacterium]
MKRLALIVAIIGVSAIAVGPVLKAQTPAIAPVTIGSTMPDITLPAYQGGDVTLSQFRGKTVILIFPRGYSGPGAWCHVCNYQYSELVDFDAREQFRQKQQVEILFVLPYARDAITDWVDKYPQQLADLEAWKNPPDPAALDEAGRARMLRVRKVYPKTFAVTKGHVPLPFPILVDADRLLSKGLGVFTIEWSGSKVDQNVPTVLVIDAKGVVQFKYMSQSTTDRPGASYLARVVEWVKSGR